MRYIILKCELKTFFKLIQLALTKSISSSLTRYIFYDLIFVIKNIIWTYI